MLLLAPFILDKCRAYVPAAALGLAVIPFNTLYFPIGCASWILRRRWIQEANNFLYRTYVRSTLFVFENVSAVKISLYGDVDFLNVQQETAIVISNHQCDVDWAAISMLIARQQPNGYEHGLRFVVKDVIRFVPLFGWYIFQHGYIYVRRFGSFMPEPVLRQLEHLKSLNEPFWLHIFPEGTRFTFKKQNLINESKKYCQQINRQPLEHVLAPRSKAFNLTVDNLRDVLDAVYDVTIAYTHTDEKQATQSTQGRAPNMLQFCTNAMPYRLHVHVRRIPISDVPIDIAPQRLWLHELFEEKDRLLKILYSTGAFPEPVKNVDLVKKPLLCHLIPFLCFTSSITVLPWLYPRECGIIYATTLAISPLLIAWMHIRKSI